MKNKKEGQKKKKKEEKKKVEKEKKTSDQVFLFPASLMARVLLQIA